MIWCWGFFVVVLGWFGFFIWQPLRASSRQLCCASAVQTHTEVGNAHVQRAERLLREENTTSSITNKGQVKDLLGYSCWLQSLARQLKARGIIHILPREEAAVGLQAEHSCSNGKMVLL